MDRDLKLAGDSLFVQKKGFTHFVQFALIWAGVNY
jgi:hypothetical protein